MLTLSETYDLKAVLSAVDNGFTKTITSFNNKIDTLEDKIKKVNAPAEKTFGGRSPFIKFGIASSVASKGLDLIKGSIDGAVSRFDTMNQFPKVMSKLGFSSEDSSKAVKKLSKGIEGLPTRLDDVVSTAQNFALMNGDLDRSVDLTLALNNAFLASGKGAEDASRGLVQFQQMMSANKVDMQSWQTLVETMPLALNEVAKSFGFTGESAKNDLYEALKSGNITFKEFGDKVIELSNKTGGFAEVAKTASEGIATSFTNIKSATIKGVTKVIEGLDKLSIALSGKGIAKNLDSFKSVINTTFNAVAVTIDALSVVLKPVGQAIVSIGSAARFAEPVLVTLASALLGLMVVERVRSAINGAGDAFLSLKAKAAKAIYSIGEFVLKAVGAQTSMGALGAAAAAAGGGIKGFAVAVKAAVASIPVIGWVIAGVSAVLGGLAYALSRTSKEMEKNAKEAEKLKQKSEDLSGKIKSSNSAFESQKNQLKVTRDELNGMVDEVFELSNKSNRSAAETKLLNKNIEELNKAVGDNVFKFDKQTGTLNASKEAMQAYIDVAMKEKELEAIQQRIIDLRVEKLENDALLKDSTEKLSKAEEEYNSHTIKFIGDGKLAGQAVKDLTEAKENAAKTSEEISAKEKALLKDKDRLQKEVNDSMMKKNKERVDNYVELSEEEKKVLDSLQKRYDDLANKATNAFDTISQKQAISVEQMIKNLKENQKAIADYGNNMGQLRDRLSNLGLDTALLQQFEKMGPEAGLQLAKVVGTSDEKLIELANTLSNGGSVATKALSNSVTDGTQEDVLPSVKTMGTEVVNEVNSGLSKDKFVSAGKNVNKGVKSGLTQSKSLPVTEGKKVQQDMLNAIESGSQQKAKTTGKNITKGLAKGTLENKPKATGAVEKVKKDSEGKMVSAWTAYQTFGQELVTGLQNGIDGRAFKPAQAMVRTAKKIQDAFNYKKTKFTSIGKELAIGLANGISSKSSLVYSTARRIANGAVQAARKAADVHSPSRKTTQIGRFMGQGFAVGLDKEKDRVNKSMENLVDTSKFKNDFDYQLEGLNSNLTNNLDSTISQEISVNNKPMIINLEMLGKSFQAFVDDITAMQDRKINLQLEYN